MEIAPLSVHHSNICAMLFNEIRPANIRFDERANLTLVKYIKHEMRKVLSQNSFSNVTVLY